MPTNTTPLTEGYEQRLRDMNAELLISSLRQSELTDVAEKAGAESRLSGDQSRERNVKLRQNLSDVNILYAEIENSRRAALNLMEDAILTRERTNRLNLELRESEERRKLAQNAGNVGIFDWNIAEDTTYWSETMWNFYGESRREVNPDEKFWSSRIHPADLARVRANIRKVVAGTGDEFRDEFQIVRNDRSVRWIEATAKVVRDDSGTAIRMYGVNLDISERKAQEKSLQDAHDALEVRVRSRTKELAQSNLALLKQIDEREAAEGHRNELLKRLVSSQEVERRRIARDLHDQLGQRLTALRLRIASLKEAAGDNKDIVERVEGLFEIGERLDAEVSFLAWELRPTALDDLGIVEAVGAFVYEWSKHCDIPAEFHTSKIGTATIDREIETHLYRITQEALNNIAKHSGAQNVSVLLETRDTDLTLIIEDNGCGFDLAQTREASETGGLGLLGMSERAVLIDGTVEIESAPGKGTTIYVRVPLPV